MADGICDVCRTRPASVQAQARVDGRRRTVELCEQDHRRLAGGRARARSPFESLFGGGSPLGSMVEDMLRERGLPGAFGGEAPGADELRLGPRRPRASVDVAELLSERAREMLQAAARHAGERGRSEVDTENLLHALADADVVQAVLDQVKVKPAELQRLIDEGAARARSA